MFVTNAELPALLEHYVEFHLFIRTASIKQYQQAKL